ncbi:MAG: isoamylase early set domain-containing protein [Chloroflexota bacterium]
MLIKNDVQPDGIREVRFTLPPEINAQTACLCGDFNDWDETLHPMKRAEDGSFSLTVKLQAGQHYQFRYFVDQTRWENDWAADRYIPNLFGSDNSVVEV